MREIPLSLAILPFLACSDPVAPTPDITGKWSGVTSSHSPSNPDREYADQWTLNLTQDGNDVTGDGVIILDSDAPHARWEVTVSGVADDPEYTILTSQEIDGAPGFTRDCRLNATLGDSGGLSGAFFCHTRDWFLMWGRVTLDRVDRSP